MAGVFQVVGECAHVTADSPTGPMIVLRFKGALVDPNDPRLPHLLTTGLVKEVGGEASQGVNADGLTEFEAEQLEGDEERPVQRRDSDGVVDRTFRGEPLRTSGDQNDGDDEARQEKRREAARAKLPQDGSAPDGRSSKEVWVEYGVAQGRDRKALEALSVEDLRRELKPRG